MATKTTARKPAAKRQARAVHRNLRLVSPAPRGADVKALKQAINKELRHRKLGARCVKPTDVLTTRTMNSAHLLGRAMGLNGKRLEAISNGHISPEVQHLLRNPEDRSRADRAAEKLRRPQIEAVRQRLDTGPKAAVGWLEKQAAAGVHEIGESNTGPVVDEVQAFFGLHGEPWCGCAAGYAARKFGGSTVELDYPSGYYLIDEAGTKGSERLDFDEIVLGTILVLWDGEHVVTARGKPTGDSIATVEGNTSPNDGDDQADGGCFATKVRSRSDVSAAIWSTAEAVDLTTTKGAAPMQSVLKAAGNAAKRLGDVALDLYRRYPARSNALVAGAVVAGLGVVGVSVDLASVKEVVAVEIPILVAGEGTHRLVSPSS